MKVNDVVMIYDDPITMKKQEGYACIKSFEIVDDADSEVIGYRCKVQFAGEETTYTRTVYEYC